MVEFADDISVVFQSSSLNALSLKLSSTITRLVINWIVRNLNCQILQWHTSNPFRISLEVASFHGIYIDRKLTQTKQLTKFV